MSPTNASSQKSTLDEFKGTLPNRQQAVDPPPNEDPMLLYVEDEHGIAAIVSLHFVADAPFSPKLVESYGLESFRTVLNDGQMAIGEHLATRPELRATSAWQNCFIDQDRTLTYVAKGDVLGEVGFLLETRRSAGGKVTSPSARVLCLSEKPLRSLVNAHPRAAATLWQNLAKILARRVVSTNRLLRLES
jgi:CRP-like cAMP-binding protein